MQMRNEHLKFNATTKLWNQYTGRMTTDHLFDTSFGVLVVFRNFQSNRILIPTLHLFARSNHCKNIQNRFVFFILYLAEKKMWPRHKFVIGLIF